VLEAVETTWMAQDSRLTNLSWMLSRSAATVSVKRMIVTELL
jgi:hypothetical protein